MPIYGYRECKKKMEEKILYAEDLVLMGESMDELRENFNQWKRTFVSKGMKVNLGKTKLMVSEIDEKTPDSKVDPCAVCGKRVMANSVLCQYVVNGSM